MARTLNSMSPRPGSQPASLVRPMQRVLVVTGVGLAALIPLATLAGWLVGGGDVAWGVLLGLLIPAVFFGLSVVVALATVRLSGGAFGAVVLGSWLVKVILLVVVLAALDGATFYSRPAFLVAFGVGVVGWLAAEWAVVTRTRTPYVDSGPDRL